MIQRECLVVGSMEDSLPAPVEMKYFLPGVDIVGGP